MNPLIVMKKQHPRYSENLKNGDSNRKQRASIEQQYYEEYGSEDIVLIHRILEFNRKWMALLQNKF